MIFVSHSNEERAIRKMYQANANLYRHSSKRVDGRSPNRRRLSYWNGVRWRWINKIANETLARLSRPFEEIR